MSAWNFRRIQGGLRAKSIGKNLGETKEVHFQRYVQHGKEEIDLKRWGGISKSGVVRKSEPQWRELREGLRVEPLPTTELDVYGITTGGRNFRTVPMSSGLSPTSQKRRRRENFGITL